MHLTAYLDAGQPMMGVVIVDKVSPLTSVRSFYEDVPGWLAEAAQTEDGFWSQAELTPAVPVPETAKVLCVALNYETHASETGGTIAERPNFFARWPSTLVASGTAIPVPDDEPGLDWEVELVVVVGAIMRSAAEAADMSRVLGYAVFNDVSARTTQYATSQYAMGKNADQSGPLGSDIITADAVDLADLRLTTRLNGELMQDGTTADMVIGVPDLLAYATRTVSLRPGDVIATGTPAGVGFRREPPVFMCPGDTIEVAVEGIGWVSNPIVGSDHRH